jgi:chorismate synthase
MRHFHGALCKPIASLPAKQVTVDPEREEAIYSAHPFANDQLAVPRFS